MVADFMTSFSRSPMMSSPSSENSPTNIPPFSSIGVGVAWGVALSPPTSSEEQGNFNLRRDDNVVYEGQNQHVYYSDVPPHAAMLRGSNAMPMFVWSKLLSNSLFAEEASNVMNGLSSSSSSDEEEEEER